VLLSGRQDEILRIRRALDRSAAGESKTLLVAGPAGIGKTALLEAAVVAAADTFTTFRVSGSTDAHPLAFGTLRDLLLQIPTDDGVLSQLLIEANSLDPSETTASSGEVLAGALVRCLSVLAESRPVLVVVDDFHWVDGSSARVFVLTSELLLADRVCILLSARTPAADFVGSPESLFETVLLMPLSDIESAAVLTSQAVPPGAIAKIVDHSAGSPLALVELARREKNPADRDIHDAELSFATGLNTDPFDIQAHYVERLNKLTTQAQRFCAAAAYEPDLNVLSALFGESASFCADEADAASLLTVRSGRIEFVHPLICECAAELLTATERRSIHASLASFFAEGAHSDLDRAALHLGHAAGGTDERAADALSELAERATRRGSVEEPIAALRWALRLTADRQKHDRWLLQIGYLHFQKGDSASAIEICDRLRAADTSLGFELDHLLADASTWERDPSRLAKTFRSQADELYDSDPTRSSLLLSQVSENAFLHGDIVGGIQDANRAIVLAQSQGDEFAAIYARAALRWNLSLHGDNSRDEELADVLPLLRIVASAPSLDGLAISLLVAMMDLMHERWAEAERITADSAPTARRLGDRLATILLDAIQSCVSWRRGRWREALPLIEQHFDSEPIPRISLAWMRAAAAVVHASLGHEEETRSLTASSLQTAHELRVPLVVAWSNAAIGLLELGYGRSEAALQHLDEVDDVARLMGLGIPGFLLWSGDHIDALIDTGRLDDATIVLKELASQSPTRWNLGVVARGRARLCDQRDKAIEFSEVALSEFAAAGMPFEMARTRLVRGRLFAELDAEKSAAELRAALRTFRKLAAQGWAEQTTAALDKLSLSHPRRSETNANQKATPETTFDTSQLTRGELRVALLVAAGRSNRQVAEELYISEKTVEFHLRSIYTKFGVRRRIEFANSFNQTFGMQSLSQQ
jgi:DNA-binding CsgD family transcriptional regulator